MNKICYAIMILLFTGCASLQYAGTASYKLSPVFSKNGAVVCCSVEIHNGKEIASLKAHLKKTADGDYEVILEEQGVAAFAGQQIASDAMKLAVSQAAKVAVAAALAPILPALIPAAGAALAAPGIAAAAVGAGGVIAAQKMTAPKP